MLMLKGEGIRKGGVMDVEEARGNLHVLLELLEMLLLLSKLLLQLQQLLLLAHADCVVLGCLFALGECIASIVQKKGF